STGRRRRRTGEEAGLPVRAGGRDGGAGGVERRWMSSSGRPTGGSRSRSTPGECPRGLGGAGLVDRDAPRPACPRVRAGDERPVTPRAARPAASGTAGRG